MDFASLMNKELSKAKTTKDPSKKYLKRSELEEERRKAYLAEQKALEEEREAKAAAKRKREEELAAENAAREEKRRKLAQESRKLREEREEEEERARRRRLGLPELVKKKEEDGVQAAEDDVPEEELREKLRELGHPVMLFGESHTARLRRYRKLTTVMSKGPIPTTLELVEEKDMRVGGTVPADKDGRKWLFRQLASYFTMVLTEYERAMEEERSGTSASKTAYSAMVQTRENMKPLFRKFESNDVDDSLLSPVVQIVQALQERRYVDANDDYLRLSIGKAAWPIGVTMVGIHERSAREKLHNGEKGHVMGDEVTRKILQSIKRCLTFAQVRWPPTDLRQLMG
ncbi:potassium channel regulatory factor [Metarhizium album ARSEF 1941]|uniref:Pre-mRNA-splicing factor 18 n=1 Tax=Metarhizium album (strain ARSEF 1941) TaxID=1081103 RepID=A0A0B2WUA5_METAS|nr:potassium channel regulatory factor [Metarhizium album ARSEF 1941]KHN97643.1 potassium channel regulatory factor [Metarhizium album ARSEF 1941]